MGKYTTASLELQGWLKAHTKLHMLLLANHNYWETLSDILNKFSRNCEAFWLSLVVYLGQVNHDPPWLSKLSIIGQLEKSLFWVLSYWKNTSANLTHIDAWLHLPKHLCQNYEVPALKNIWGWVNPRPGSFHGRHISDSPHTVPLTLMLHFPSYLCQHCEAIWLENNWVSKPWVWQPTTTGKV